MNFLLQKGRVGGGGGGGGYDRIYGSLTVLS